MADRIVFRGGPFDAHAQTMPARETLQKRLVLPVSAHALSILSGGPALPQKVTSYAAYDLIGDAYVFAGAGKDPNSLANMEARPMDQPATEGPRTERGDQAAGAGSDGRKLDPLSVHVRWMIRRDMPEVLEIERECFEFPWSEDDFLRCLRQRNCIGMVAEVNDVVAGVMVFERGRTKLHLLNFSVHPKFQRRGVGKRMLNRLKAWISEERQRIILEVRETNLPMQLFLRSQGFKALISMHDFYDDAPQEDAILFQYRHRSEA